VYFIGLLTVFIVALPFLYLYATGYRFDGSTTLVSTGGVYVAVPHSGTEIYIDGELIRETGAFRRAFYIQDLDPGMYTIEVRKELHHVWQKELEVFPQIVTEARAFTLPNEIAREEIPKTFVIETASGTTTPIANPRYEEVLDFFTATTTALSVPEEILVSTLDKNEIDVQIATSTRESGGMQLARSDVGVIASWTRSVESVPFYFCIPHGACIDEIIVGPPEKEILYFDFVPGDNNLVLLALEEGVYVSEIDARDVQNIQPVAVGENIDVRVRDGVVYIREGDKLFEVTL